MATPLATAMSSSARRLVTVLVFRKAAARALCTATRRLGSHGTGARAQPVAAGLRLSHSGLSLPEGCCGSHQDPRGSHRWAGGRPGRQARRRAQSGLLAVAVAVRRLSRWGATQRALHPWRSGPHSALHCRAGTWHSSSPRCNPAGKCHRSVHHQCTTARRA